MKKLIMATFALVACVAANAASFNWSCTGSRTTGTIYNYAGTVIGSGTTAYLFDAAVVSQATLLASIRDGNAITSLSSISTATTASSKIAATAAFEYGSVGNDYTAYFAILDTDNNQLLISSVATAQGQQGDTSLFGFGANAATWSKEKFGDASYSVAGWYSTAAVPEPTSGLLLLLGMAGLALKRKRA